MGDRSPQGDSDNGDLFSRGKSLSTQVTRYASTYLKWFIGLVAGVITRDLFNRIAEGLLQRATFQHYATIGFIFGFVLAVMLILSTKTLEYKVDNNLESKVDNMRPTEASHQTSASIKRVPSLKILLAGVLIFYMIGFFFRELFSPSLLFGIAGFVVVLWGISVLSE